MMHWVRMGAALALGLVAAACFFVPGEFQSHMRVGADGRFEFSYTGDVVFALSPQLMGTTDTSAEPIPCYDEDSYEDRACTEEELAEQAKARADAAADTARKTAEFAAMFGGINPSDPKSMDEFAAKLAKLDGYRSVVHRGDGVFRVDYVASGTLDRDFVWPVFPGIDIVKPFVVAQRRADGRVLVRAPGYAAESGDMLRKMEASMQIAGTNGIAGNGPPSVLNGRFILTTDGAVLTNNTEDGPVTEGAVQRLAWAVTRTETKVPEALIALR